MPSLRDLATARSGDKGDTATLGVVCRDPADYPLLAAWLTPERVAAFLAPDVRGPVRRHELPGLAALLFVLEGALEGGVTRSLALDPHGKSLAFSLLAMPLPQDVAARSRLASASAGR